MRIRDARFGIVNVAIKPEEPPKDPILPGDREMAATAAGSARGLVNVVSRGSQEALDKAQGRNLSSICSSPTKVRNVATSDWIWQTLKETVWPGRGQPIWDPTQVAKVLTFWGKACGLVGVLPTPSMGPEGSGFFSLLAALSIKIGPDNQHLFVQYADDFAYATALAEEIKKNPDGTVAAQARRDMAQAFPCSAKEEDEWAAAEQAERDRLLAEGEKQRAEEERKRQEVLRHNAEAAAYKAQALIWAREYKAWAGQPQPDTSMAPALALAAAGFFVGGPVGAAAGGVVGLVAGGAKGTPPPVAPTPPSWMTFDMRAKILSEAQAAA